MKIKLRCANTLVAYAYHSLAHSDIGEQRLSKGDEVGTPGQRLVLQHTRHLVRRSGHLVVHESGLSVGAIRLGLRLLEKVTDSVDFLLAGHLFSRHNGQLVHVEVGRVAANCTM